MKKEEIIKKLNDNFRRQYRLADCFKDCVGLRQSPLVNQTLEKYPNSLFSKIYSDVMSSKSIIEMKSNIQRASGFDQKELYRTIAEEVLEIALKHIHVGIKKIDNKPQASIHLRLGDVVPSKLTDKNTHHYFTPLSTFEKKITTLKEYLGNSNTVELFCGLHTNSEEKTNLSADYIVKLINLLKKYRINSTCCFLGPDASFLRMVSSSALVYGNSGYGQLAAFICNKIGNKSYYIGTNNQKFSSIGIFNTIND